MKTIYEVYGYTYLDDDVWGDVWLADFDNKKDAIKLASKVVDGQEFTNSSVYEVTGEGEEDQEMIFTYY